MERHIDNEKKIFSMMGLKFKSVENSKVLYNGIIFDKEELVGFTKIQNNMLEAKIYSDKYKYTSASIRSKNEKDIEAIIGLKNKRIKYEYNSKTNSNSLLYRFGKEEKVLIIMKDSISSFENNKIYSFNFYSIKNKEEDLIQIKNTALFFFNMVPILFENILIEYDVRFKNIILGLVKKKQLI